MRILGSALIVFSAAIIALPAHANSHSLAGAPTYTHNSYMPTTQYRPYVKKRHKHAKKYTMENGVKVYRNAPNAQQQAVIDQKRQRLIQDAAFRRQLDLERDLIEQARRQKRKAEKRAYKAGYHDGVHAAEARCRQQCARRPIYLRQRIRSRNRALPIVLNRRNKF